MRNINQVLIQDLIMAALGCRLQRQTKGKTVHQLLGILLGILGIPRQGGAIL